MRKPSRQTAVNSLAILNLGFSLAHAIAKNLYASAFHLTIGVLMVIIGWNVEEKK